MRIQKPRQGTLFPEIEVNVEEVSQRFLQISQQRPRILRKVSDRLYPMTSIEGPFFKLTRNLAPTGSPSVVSPLDPAFPEVEPIVLGVESREGIRAALKKQLPRSPSRRMWENVQLRGVLRALDLDNDWIEIVVRDAGGLKHIRIQT